MVEGIVLYIRFCTSIQVVCVRCTKGCVHQEGSGSPLPGTPPCPKAGKLATSSSSAPLEIWKKKGQKFQLPWQFYPYPCWVTDRVSATLKFEDQFLTLLETIKWRWDLGRGRGVGGCSVQIIGWPTQSQSTAHQRLLPLLPTHCKWMDNDALSSIPILWKFCSK